MASQAPKLKDLQDKDQAKAESKRIAAIDAAANAAREAELARQEEIVAAVAQANAEELPKLGGPLLDPGLGK